MIILSAPNVHVTMAEPELPRPAKAGRGETGTTKALVSYLLYILLAIIKVCFFTHRDRILTDTTSGVRNVVQRMIFSKTDTH